MSEFRFEDENQPVCSSVSSCLTEYFFNLHVYTLLFNKHHLYNSVSCGRFSSFSVFGHFVLFKIRIIDRKK